MCGMKRLTASFLHSFLCCFCEWYKVFVGIRNEHVLIVSKSMLMLQEPLLRSAVTQGMHMLLWAPSGVQFWSHSYDSWKQAQLGHAVTADFSPIPAPIHTLCSIPWQHSTSWKCWLVPEHIAVVLMGFFKQSLLPGSSCYKTAAELLQSLVFPPIPSATAVQTHLFWSSFYKYLAVNQRMFQQITKITVAEV